MRRLGIFGTYLFFIFLTISLAHDFSRGYSLYCKSFEATYAELGFNCSTHVNSFLAAFLANPQTYFFTISLLMMILLFFQHIPYLKPEYWVRVADKSRRWVGKKILLTSFSAVAVLYSSFVVAGFVLGFSSMWEVQFLLYPLYLFIYSTLIMTMFHVVYVLSEKPIIALFTFFFTNFIFFVVISEIAWQTLLDATFVRDLSIFYVFFMLASSFITLIIALKRKECYK